MPVLETLGLLTLVGGGAYRLIRRAETAEADRQMERVYSEYKPLYEAGKLTPDEFSQIVAEAEVQREKFLRKEVRLIIVTLPPNSLAAQERRQEDRKTHEKDAMHLRQLAEVVLARTPELDPARLPGAGGGDPHREAIMLLDYLAAAKELGLVSKAEIQALPLTYRSDGPPFHTDPKSLLRGPA